MLIIDLFGLFFPLMLDYKVPKSKDPGLHLKPQLRVWHVIVCGRREVTPRSREEGIWGGGGGGVLC